MFKASQIPEPSRDFLDDLVKDGEKHAHYSLVCKRADIMGAWYGGNEAFIGNNELKKQIITKSSLESQAEYNERLETYPILPFEYKLIQSQQRIYDDNNVSREYDSEFWKQKETCFDDQGDDINTFFEDKVLPVHEMQGFGGIAFDYAMDNEGKAITIEGAPVPYPYVIQAKELMNYDLWYGMLRYVVTCQKRDGKEEYRVFTPNFIHLYNEEREWVKSSRHTFGETPFIMMKGAPDPESGFKVGLPRRWNISQVYKDVCDLFYDLKKASMLYAHPIPIMHVDAVKEIAGVLDNDNNLINDLVKQELGTIVTYTGEDAPNQLFLQADMQGLNHLTQVIFDKLIPFVYQMASVRDKSKVVHNASGRSKQFDSVEEQGLLSQTASDMESLEKRVFQLMYKARRDKGEATVVYNKHHDLRTADEIWTQLTEAYQYASTSDGRVNIPKSTLNYLLTEFMKKSSAPQDVQNELKEELSTFYDNPLTNNNETE